MARRAVDAGEVPGLAIAVVVDDEKTVESLNANGLGTFERSKE